MLLSKYHNQLVNEIWVVPKELNNILKELVRSK